MKKELIYTPQIKEDNQLNFSYQDLDEEVNIPDLQKWVDAKVLYALIDEESGGIIGYIHYQHIDRITGILNSMK